MTPTTPAAESTTTASAASIGKPKPAPPVVRLAQVIARAAAFPGLDPGERAALARLDPEAMRPAQVGALARALVLAGLEPDGWRPQTWMRWALVAHGLALAGHDGTRRLGEQLALAGVAESRVTRLLTARGDAFRQTLARLLRLMASKAVAPNWHELAELVLREGDEAARESLEALRLRIAGAYYTALARRARS